MIPVKKKIKKYTNKIPWVAYIPKGDRLALAIVSAIFWGSALSQAIWGDSHGASVYAFFGLGLIYVIFSISNVIGAMRREVRKTSSLDLTQLSLVAQLFAVLSGILIMNISVLVIYLLKLTHFTLFDFMTISAALFALIAICIVYGIQSIHKNPMARGWIALVGKTIPQTSMMILFIIQPSALLGFSLLTLAGNDVLAALRLAPALRAFQRDIHSRNLRGLLLGEIGNTISAFLLSFVWCIGWWIMAA